MWKTIVTVLRGKNILGLNDKGSTLMVTLSELDSRDSLSKEYTVSGYCEKH